MRAEVLPDRRAALRAHGAMALFAAMVSVSFSLGGRAAPFIDPGAMTAGRFAIAAGISLAVAGALIRARHFRAPWRYLLLGGMFASYFVLMFEALRLTDPVSTAAIFTLTPAMSAVFAWFLLRQTTPLWTLAALGIGGAGAIWVVFRGDVEALLGLDFGLGEQLFLLGCAIHALYTPMVRRLSRGEPAAVFGLGVLLGGLLTSLAWSAPAVSGTDWLALPAVVWIAMLYLGAAATAATFFLMRYATMRLPSAKVLAYGYLVPSFVILWEGIFAGDWVGMPVWLGVGATLAALVMLLAPDRA
ncbi:hypothetical protein LNKW23_11980 [Paralimibaculum aggregatum]|uniref:EamA domain-containing protein n=1 Tax=Paralimibaculum aggregatum TaxID=3036245 RepID=A0ABQ6LP01_9RHOB|nr:DMT family transporter [Limibaculum sp. NKW23]GMG81985.1 hypothetical protein LNKW23_11980 [Limibaculum sp. NKW23]